MKQVVTEDELRINELCRDLEEHTGVQNYRLKDRAAAQQRIRKSPYKMIKDEREACAQALAQEMIEA